MTQPIVESTTGIKFGTFGLSYNGLQEQQHRAGLNTDIISWTEVYDFTPLSGEVHWKYLENENQFSLKTMSVDTYQRFADLDLKFLKKRPVLVSIESTV